MMEAFAWGLFWWIIVSIAAAIFLARLTGMND